MFDPDVRFAGHLSALIEIMDSLAYELPSSQCSGQSAVGVKSKRVPKSGPKILREHARNLALPILASQPGLPTRPQAWINGLALVIYASAATLATMVVDTHVLRCKGVETSHYGPRHIIWRGNARG